MVYDILIKNGIVFDGSGKEAIAQDIGVKGDKILTIGKLKNKNARTEINAEGKFVSPGFIDINNDADHYLNIFEFAEAESAIRQGITTILCGNCGASLAPLIKGSLVSIQKWAKPTTVNINWRTTKEFLDFLEKNGIGVNFATLSGWGTLRRDIAGDDFRNLAKDELEKLKLVVEKSLKEGAWGVSFGLGYSHEKMVGLEEMLVIAAIIKKYNGLMTFHLRDEALGFLASVCEIIELAKKSGVSSHISHLKVIGKPYFNDFIKALEMITEIQNEGVNLNFDIYPYETNAQVLYLVLPEWVAIGGKKALLRNITDPIIKKKVITDLKKRKYLYQDLIIADAGEQWWFSGKTLAEIARDFSLTFEETLLRLLEITEDRVIVFSPNLSKNNIELAIKSPYSIIATNSTICNIDFSQKGSLVHPRAFGTFPLFLGYYVRERKLISWEEALAKITGKVAQKIGLRERGFLKENYFADIVIFDAEKIKDKGTLKNPFQYPQGIETVIINGKIAFHRGHFFQGRFGKILRRK